MKRILLIDDDQIVNFINSKIVETEFPGVQYMVFKNGLEALEYIVENPETPYLGFLDINMPVMNGWEFLDALSKQQDLFDLQIHILTSSIDRNDRIKAGQYRQVQSFLHKPLNKTQLKDIKQEFYKK